MHTPVLLNQVMQNFGKVSGKQIIDATFGEGGHSMELVKGGANVLALDADIEQIMRFKDLKDEVYGLKVVNADFNDLEEVAVQNGFKNVYGVLFDFGLSYNQYLLGGGFSYNASHQPLDMIINSLSKQKGTTRAADVLNYTSELELGMIFKKWGEVAGSTVLANVIVKRRKEKKFEFVGDLLNVLEGRFESQKAKVFMSLRIVVNDEFEKIKNGVAGALKVLEPNGILQLITFHSLEDRFVKSIARAFELREVAKVVGKTVSGKSYEKPAVLRVYKK